VVIAPPIAAAIRQCNLAFRLSTIQVGSCLETLELEARLTQQRVQNTLAPNPPVLFALADRVNEMCTMYQRSKSRDFDLQIELDCCSGFQT
jgi:hypothetical protein